MTYDIYYDHWGQVVTWGTVMLALGTTVYEVGCLHLAWVGHWRVAAALALAGAVLAFGSVGGAVYLDLVETWRWSGTVTRIAGMTIPLPDMLFLPDDAIEWSFLGLSLAIMGVGLAAIRGRPGQSPRWKDVGP